MGNTLRSSRTPEECCIDEEGPWAAWSNNAVQMWGTSSRDPPDVIPVDLNSICLSGYLDTLTLDRLTLCRMPELLHTTEVREEPPKLHFLQ